MQVRAYKNLNKGCVSIQAKVAAGWRVVAYADAVQLSGVTFTVSESGRQRVIRTGQREVHAYAIGELAAWRGGELTAAGAGMAAQLLATQTAVLFKPTGRAITYRPHTCPSFTDRATGQAVTCARSAFIEPDGCVI